ncbi:MAG: DNA-binding protein [Thermoprotei archaeon]|nr:MAG: DNA-binding protein [Thermoprotei archaeon]
MYLFDASSIVNIIKRGLTRPLSDGATLDLALYECITALWKEHLLLGVLSKELVQEFVELVSDIFKVIPTYSIDGREDSVFDLAVRERITPYDASYLIVAIENGHVLVTDDRKLLEVALKYIRAITTSQFLSRYHKK